MKKILSTVLCAALVSCNDPQDVYAQYTDLRPIAYVLFWETIVVVLYFLYLYKWKHWTQMDYEDNQGMDKGKRRRIALALTLIIIGLSSWAAVVYGVFRDSSGQDFLIVNSVYLIGMVVTFLLIDYFAQKKSHRQGK